MAAVPAHSDFGIQENKICQWFHFSPFYLSYSDGTVWITINWKILKEMGYQTTWPASWETYLQVRKQQLELDMEQQTGSK